MLVRFVFVVFFGVVRLVVVFTCYVGVGVFVGVVGVVVVVFWFSWGFVCFGFLCFLFGVFRCLGLGCFCLFGVWGWVLGVVGLGFVYFCWFRFWSLCFGWVGVDPCLVWVGVWFACGGFVCGGLFVGVCLFLFSLVFYFFGVLCILGLCWGVSSL